MEVTFCVHCDKTAPGQHVRVVGSAAPLGSWCPDNGLPLATSSELFPQWVSEPMRLPDNFEYKFVICGSTGDLVTWEDRRSNRAFNSTIRTLSVRIEDLFGSEQESQLIPAPDDKEPLFPDQAEISPISKSKESIEGPVCLRPSVGSWLLAIPSCMQKCEDKFHEMEARIPAMPCAREEQFQETKFGKDGALEVALDESFVSADEDPKTDGVVPHMGEQSVMVGGLIQAPCTNVGSMHATEELEPEQVSKQVPSSMGAPSQDKLKITPVVIEQAKDEMQDPRQKVSVKGHDDIFNAVQAKGNSELLSASVPAARNTIGAPGSKYRDAKPPKAKASTRADILQPSVKDQRVES